MYYLKWDRCQVSVISSFLSHLNTNLKQRMLKPSARPSSWTVHRSWTDQFYLENKGEYILEAWGHANPKGAKRRERERKRDRERVRVGVGGRERERKRPGPLAPLLICFFLPLGLPCVNWASQECLFYLRSSLWSLDLPLFYFHGLFPPLSFRHCHSGLLSPILTT